VVYEANFREVKKKKEIEKRGSETVAHSASDPILFLDLICTRLDASDSFLAWDVWKASYFFAFRFTISQGEIAIRASARPMA
jgi:hypothetical protein